MVINQTRNKEKHIHVFAAHHFPFSQAYAKDLSSKGGFTIYIRASIARLPAVCCNRKCIQDNLGVHHNAWLEIISIQALQRVAMHIQIIVCTSGCNIMQAIVPCLLEIILWTLLIAFIITFTVSGQLKSSLKLDYTRSTEKRHVHVCTYPKLFSQGLSLSVTGQIHWLPIRQDLCLCNNTHVNIGRFPNHPLHSTDRVESMSAQNGCAES